MRILVGLPRLSSGPLAEAAQQEGAAVLVSAGSFWNPKKGEFRVPPRRALATLRASLDSAGYVAMTQGGYRWSPQDYVDFVVTAASRATGGELGWAWDFWAAMDYCVEPQIAKNRTEVLQRIDKTAETLSELLAGVDAWRDEGDTETPDPMPVLQGWKPEDYIRSTRLTERILSQHRRTWPELVGVGSVCRRPLHGETGLLRVLEAVHCELPSYVRLHLFGVKSGALRLLLDRFSDRIASVDSMAWDSAARWKPREPGVRAQQHRAGFLRRWLQKQREQIE